MANNFQQSMHCDLDILTLDPEINRTNAQLWSSLCVKFHDYRCKGEAIMRHNPFSVINSL